MSEGSYNQFCPVAMAAEILCTRWTLVVLRELAAGSTRFNDLRRGLPRMSPALLSKRLKDLERAGIVVRAQVPGETGVFEYRLTDGGRELAARGRGRRRVGPQVDRIGGVPEESRYQPADVGHPAQHRRDADAAAGAATSSSYSQI